LSSSRCSIVARVAAAGRVSLGHRETLNGGEVGANYARGWQQCISVRHVFLPTFPPSKTITLIWRMFTFGVDPFFFSSRRPLRFRMVYWFLQLSLPPPPIFRLIGLPSIEHLRHCATNPLRTGRRSYEIKTTFLLTTCKRTF